MSAISVLTCVIGLLSLSLVRAGATSCTDKRNDCAEMKRRRFCVKAALAEYMAIYCRKTCNVDNCVECKPKETACFKPHISDMNNPMESYTEICRAIPEIEKCVQVSLHECPENIRPIKLFKNDCRETECKRKETACIRPHTSGVKNKKEIIKKMCRAIPVIEKCLQVSLHECPERISAFKNRCRETDQKNYLYVRDAGNFRYIHGPNQRYFK